MRQNLYKKSALFLGALVLSGAVFSASVDKDELANEWLKKDVWPTDDFTVAQMYL